MSSSVHELVSVESDSGVADPWAAITRPDAQIASRLGLPLADCTFLLENRDSCIPNCSTASWHCDFQFERSCETMLTVAARGYLPPGANVCVAAPPPPSGVFRNLKRYISGVHFQKFSNFSIFFFHSKYRYIFFTSKGAQA